ncbi:MAG: cyclic nucleotide-binding domain-containing protein [Syntrophales bacterium]|nr:cyclic nucleotide-binding domain-containing protein [Syntrophales bacterium]
MLQIASYEKYQDGQIIFKEGDSGDWVYVVESGSVELSKMIGDTKIVIEVLRREGDVFGEMAFIANISRTATASAIGPTTVGIIDRNYLDDEFNRLSGSFQAILKSLVLRLKKTTEAIAQAKVKA